MAGSRGDAALLVSSTAATEMSETPAAFSLLIGMRARKRGGSAGKIAARACSIMSANSFSEIRFHTLKIKWPPGRRTRRASLGYSPAYYVGYGYGGNYGRPFYAYGGPINRHVVAHCYHNSH